MSKASNEPSSVVPDPARATRDDAGWDHPWLTRRHLTEFRRYSGQVWAFADEIARREPPWSAAPGGAPLRTAFAVNMAQNMYIWCKIVRHLGLDAQLYLHPHDTFLVSQPEWEEYDGDCEDIWQDASTFLSAHPELETPEFVHRPPVDAAFHWALSKLQSWDDPHAVLRFLREHDEVVPERMFWWPAYSAFWPLIRALTKFDVSCIASLPFFSYLSGKPYCALPVGGDLQFDAGRADDHGRLMRLSFNAARFILVNSPDYLGHCRRLGFVNAIYQPVPVDTTVYCPGSSPFRAQWHEQHGGGFHVLSSPRIDYSVKGQGELVPALRTLIGRRPDVHVHFLSWGADLERFQNDVRDAGIAGNVHFLPLAGKRRLVAYYRAADCVVDQFIFGYFGSTAMEAMAVGCPVVMKLRFQQYDPFYEGDRPPIVDVDGAAQVAKAIERLRDDAARCAAIGRASVEWVERHHGIERAGGILVNLLNLAARRTPLPDDLRHPLEAPLKRAEVAYHQGCLIDGS